MNKHKNNNVLVVIIPTIVDFEIAKSHNWYRIPVKSAPVIVKDDSVKIIAFYHTSKFEKDKFSIRWYAYVRSISIVKRSQLFPGEPLNEKSGNDYYKIEFDALLRLAIPIFSLRHRRILFIPTTEEKFFSAKEINFLFNDSPLEDILWSEFVKQNLLVERQHFFGVAGRKIFMDFALFCKTRNIDIECDGDYFHNKPNDIQADKTRNNLLESKGWSVLRFTTYDLTQNLEPSIKIIYSTINKYGGIENITNPGSFNYISDSSNQQLYLFD